MKKSLFKNICLSLACLLGIGGLTGAALTSTKEATEVSAFTTVGTFTLQDFLNASYYGGEESYGQLETGSYSDARGFMKTYCFNKNGSSLITIEKKNDLGSYMWYELFAKDVTHTGIRMSFTTDKQISPTFDFDDTVYTIPQTSTSGGYSYGLTKSLNITKSHPIRIFFTSEVGYKLTAFKFEVLQGAPTYPVAITAGTGVSSVYLSNSSTATSGSASGGEFNEGSTVYGFAVLAKGYNAPSSWALVSGTANTAGAKYRVGSVTAGSGNFGTQNATLATYTITYDLDGGSTSQSNPTSYNVNTSSFTLQQPGKPFYKFEGWTGSNGTTPQLSVTVNKGTSGNLSYKANWSVATYLITYYLDGGTVTPSNPTSYDMNTETFTLNNPTKCGYDFEGWYGDDITGYSKEVTITQGVTWGAKAYYAKWKLNDKLQAVIDAINAIDSEDIIYPDSKGEIVNAEDLYNALSADEKAVLSTDYASQVQKMESARDEYNDYRDSFIEDAINAIDAIGDPSLVVYPDSHDALFAAESAFYELDGEDQSATVVPNMDNLIAAREEYDAQKAVKVQEVIEAIDAIGIVSYPESKEALENAEALFAALANEEKNSTSVTNLDALTQARPAYNAERDDEIQDVIDAINAIVSPFDIHREDQIANAQELYDALDDSDKNATVVTNLERLENAKAADAVADMIEELATITDKDTFLNKVSDANLAYNSLTEAQQAFIPDSLKAILDDNVAASAVIFKIDDIGSVTFEEGIGDSLELIADAESGYAALSNDQKAIVNRFNHDVLTHDRTVYDDVKNVADLIKAIPAESESSDYYDAVDAAEAAYKALTDEEKAILNATVSKDFDKTLNDQVAVREVIESIQDIGKVTFNGGEHDSSAPILAAQFGYLLLNDEQKAIVNGVNYDDLDAKATVYGHVNDVALLIQAIPEPSDTQVYYDAVKAANDAYNALTGEEKAIINAAENVDYEKVLEDNVKASGVIKEIQAIGDVTYSKGDGDSLAAIESAEANYAALTEDQKALVDAANKSDLDHDRSVYDKVDAAANLINAIGEVSHTEEKDSKEALHAARNAYDALSEEEKALVAGYNDSYQTLVDDEAVYAAMVKIDAIGEVGYDTRSEGAVNEAGKVYDSLSEDQKAQLGDAYLKTLTSAKTKYSELKKTADIWVIVLLVVASLLVVGAIWLLVVLLKKKKNDNDDQSGNSGSSKKEPVKAMSVGGFLPFVILTSHYLDVPYLALYVLAGVAVLLWIAVMIIAIVKKSKKKKAALEAPKAKANEISASEDEAKVNEVSASEDEEESVTVTDENGNVFNIRFVKSFTAKLIQSPEETKKYYEELKNEVLSYKKTNSRISWHFDSVNSGRNYVLRFAIRGKTLCVYLPLNADDYADSKYKVEKAESKKYEDVPCLYRIKNDRRLGYAKELIAAVASNLGLEKGEEQHEIYSNLPYEPNKPLLERGLIKELKVQVNKPAETIVEAEEEEAEKVAEEKAKIEAEEKRVSLAQSMALARENKDHKSLIGKEFCASYLEQKHAGSVEINRRENQTSTGLPLADTHFAVEGSKRKCFVYVYETEGSPMLLINAKESLAKEIMERHQNVHLSAFPKSKDAWYSLLLDDTYTEEEVGYILDRCLASALGKEDGSLSLKESLALAKSAKGKHTFDKKAICEYLSKYGDEVELNARGDFTVTGLPLADTHYVKLEEGKKKCFVYVYQTGGAMMLLIKANPDYVESLRLQHPEVHDSAFPKSKEPWNSVVLDDTYSDDDVRKLLDDLVIMNR